MKRYQIRGRFSDWRDVSENRMYEYALQLSEWSTLKSGCVEYFVDRYTRVVEDERIDKNEKNQWLSQLVAS